MPRNAAGRGDDRGTNLIYVRDMKRILITAALVGGCQPETPNYSAPSGDAPYRTAAPLVRTPLRVVSETRIDGVLVAVVPYAAAGWRVEAKNESDTAVSVLWDESSFVDRFGDSQGRLIRGETRRMNVDGAQPRVPIAPKAQAVQRVLVEKLLAYEEIEASMDGKLQDRDRVFRVLKIRNAVQKSLPGGRVHVVIEIDGAKKTWTGLVSPAKPAEDDEAKAEDE